VPCLLRRVRLCRGGRRRLGRSRFVEATGSMQCVTRDESGSREVVEEEVQERALLQLAGLRHDLIESGTEPGSD
jgi:hypothetical protein